MGQYTKFRKQLPRVEKVRFADDTGSDWIERVKAEKLRLSSSSFTDLAELYEKSRATKDALDAKVKDENLRMAAIERLLSEKFEDQGIEKIETAYGNFSLKDDPVVEITDQDAFYKWVRSTPGGEDLFKVYAQTANTLVKDALVNGKPLPPGTKVSMNIGINYRNSK